MTQSYKVFIQDRLLLITESNDWKSTDYNGFRIFSEVDKFDIYHIYLQLKKGKEKGAIFFSPNANEILEEFRKNLKLAEAAGGVVVNPNDEFLLIYRNGTWDLPKGKLEKGESQEEGALREVEEECGISNISLGEKLKTTYHTYERNGKDYFKPTYWFMMKIDELQDGVAQTEEGITEVKWFKREELLKKLPATYPNIEMVLEDALSRPRP